jgi:hypothetical protein
MARKLSLSLYAAASIILIGYQSAKADEGGVSFWLPGAFGSLAAVPQQPGLTVSTFYYNTNVSAGGGVALAKEFSIGNIPANVTAHLNANVTATADIGALVTTYVFANPFLGGQAAISLMGLYGGMSTSLAGTLTGSITTPGGTFPFMRSDSLTGTATGFGDLYPQFSVRWNRGVNNYMTYVMADVPVGEYHPSDLSNLGIGHGAVDAGGGYTYFNPKTGHEFSGVLGFTYNLMNTSTQYQNGVDMHFDWGASQFLSKQLQVGLVGYAYKEIGCDSGSGDRVGCFQSQVFGVGPQIGVIIPLGKMQGYINVKGYREFAALDRPSGWNAWVTFSVSPAAQAPPPAVQQFVSR